MRQSLAFAAYNPLLEQLARIREAAQSYAKMLISLSMTGIKHVLRNTFERVFLIQTPNSFGG
jgi:hypothetical protein